MPSTSNIFLGTVKLGMPDYGFSSGRPEKAFDTIDFLSGAAQLGVTHFDTSPRYGNSEAVIGRYVQEKSAAPFIASKIDNLVANNPKTPELMEQSVRNSLAKLHVPALDICYLHQNELEIIGDTKVHKGLQNLKTLGLIRKAGASLYNHEECEYAVNSGAFDVIQVPASVFDLGFYNSFVSKNSSSITFIARSLLLQGILLNRQLIPQRIKQADPVLEYLQKLDGIAESCGLSTLELALAFIFGLVGISSYVIGTTSLQNLKSNIDCLKIHLPSSAVSKLISLASEKKDWTNPRNW